MQLWAAARTSTGLTMAIEVVLPFPPKAYEVRLAGLLRVLAAAGFEACGLTSMHVVAQYSWCLH